MSTSDQSSEGGVGPIYDEAGFDAVVNLIAAARQRAVQAVNTQLIDLYW
ncbi:hypothetical protein LRH25_07355 [Ideonella azotifigens]|uniref:DUF1016 domain-containing protein n=1 Tax=Ideonella azotifigens TaxID=513160 RepID=A0ABN1JQ79_9BURK|nr:hypothetical protein [Ideonella azotifigens]MCD2340158.1 hypothetical protein [Ideonella azotifigens]